MKHILNLPPNTRVEFKSHDSAIQQRTAIEESRQGKTHHGEKRNQGHQSRSNTTGDNQTPTKDS